MGNNKCKCSLAQLQIKSIWIGNASFVSFFYKKTLSRDWVGISLAVANDYL